MTVNTAFIITVTVALILYGCYVMKKLDDRLEANPLIQTHIGIGYRMMKL